MGGGMHILLTGVTGFLGSHLAARLLRDGHHVSVIARGTADVSARQRVLHSLHELDVPCTTSIDVFEGDIARPQLGLSECATMALARTVDEVWNSAASLSFLEAQRDEIFATNVVGTQNILEFTQRTASKRLQHISTAYVAGNRTNNALESQLDIGQSFRNPYEASKCSAEQLIVAAHQRGVISATVYRPSVVIGDSVSGRVTHFHGVYGFIRGIWGIAERLRIRAGHCGAVTLPLRIPGDPAATLNFVPIDYVVNAIAELTKQPTSVGATFNLTNPHATTNQQWLTSICDVLGVQGVAFAMPSDFTDAPLTRLETAFHKQMVFHSQYFAGEPRFDCARTLAALSGTSVSCPRVSTQLMRRLAGWYVSRLSSATASGADHPSSPSNTSTRVEAIGAPLTGALSHAAHSHA